MDLLHFISFFLLYLYINKINMEITSGILKSIDSAFVINDSNNKFYLVKYNGKMFNQGGNNVRLFKTIGAAKTTINTFIMSIFRHGEYWQSCSQHIKNRTNYDVDFSATIEILPSNGLTSRFDSKETKKMIKDIVEQLLAQNIFTIEEIN